MQHTKIEWVKNPDGTQGYTWNPITGCLNGCPYCFARKLANGRLKRKYLDNYFTLRDRGHPTRTTHNDPFFPRYWPDRMDDKELWNKKPKGIFVCDMGELFGSWVPETYTKAILLSIKANPQHRFYLLTKQPQNLIKFSPFPENCYVGITVDQDEDEKTFPQALACLAKIKAKVKYISFEPLLGKIEWNMPGLVKYSGLNWVIIGQQTPIKKATMPKIEWVEEIVEAADKVGIPVFLKNNLVPVLENRKPFIFKCKEYQQYPRQEMPIDNERME